jgi:small-conductance mechanosensitive channel
MGTLAERWNQLAAWLEANDEALFAGSIAAVILVAVLLGLRSIGGRIAAADPECRSFRSVIGRIFAKTSIAFIIVAAIELVPAYAELPSSLENLWHALFIAAIALQVAVWVRELILGLINRKISEDTNETSLANALALIRVLVSVAVFAIAIIAILDNLGVNVTALVAGLGIGGIAIGLAAQGIFSDLFAALSILFDKPFKKGDTIRYDQSTGTVERIGLKTTRLRAMTGEQVIMANTKLLEREIHNLAQARSRQMAVYLAVKADEPAKAVEKIGEVAGEAVAETKGCKLVRCALTGMASGAITHELVYDDAAKEQNKLALNRAAILRLLLERLEANGLELIRASDVPAPPAPF